MRDISIIIINYNSSSYTIQCIQSIIEKTSPSINYDIIVIDNASHYDDYSKLLKEITALDNQKITIQRSKLNTGFGGGNMFGVQFANAKYYAFVNNDTILKNDCISISYNFLENTKDASICCPQQYDANDHVQMSFDHFLSLKRELFGRKILEKTNPKRYPKRKKVYTSPLKVECVPGSFLVTKASAFDQVGGFDTNIFLYYEETDLCYRIKKAFSDGNSYLVPEGQYLHFEGQSTKKSNAIKKELKLSLLYVLRKHTGYIPFQVMRFVLTGKFFFKSIIKPKNFDLFLFFLKGAPLSASLKMKQMIHKK
ncbi:glycosyltransferase [Aquimarina hainanensis]|uniref:Glycosyltransferase n=2 Tax=Aquimarina hainanensis TaxID=1578017 RepID=A0ABW5NB23_9FLAO